jgi:DNA-binding CsgD family transcriptional regulator
MAIPEKAERNVDGEDDITEIAGLKTQFDVFRYLKQLTERVRCRAFMVLKLPAVTSSTLHGNTVITNWPPELLSTYDQRKLIVNSPVVRRLRESTLPFFYDMFDKTAERTDGRSAEIRALFERFRLTRCGYFPTHDASGQRGAISFSGDREAFSPQEMRELSYISIHVFNRLAEIRHTDSRVTDCLTDREIDCLNWTSAGKTSQETAEILGLSEHTVNHYLNRATKKLDTVNRTQAVAKALRLGLIR